MAGKPVSVVAPMVVPFVTDGIAVAIAVPQASPARLNCARTVKSPVEPFQPPTRTRYVPAERLLKPTEDWNTPPPMSSLQPSKVPPQEL